MLRGDALKDMPDEYIEYVEEREREKKPPIALESLKDGPCRESGIFEAGIGEYSVTMEFENGTLEFSPNSKQAKEQSEADKAIADGKPRWIHHDILGWKYAVIESSEYRNAQPVLVYRLAHPGDGEFDRTRMIVKAGVEVLPYGEIPPPAGPEKPKPVASVVFNYDGGEWLHMADEITIDAVLTEGVPFGQTRTYIHSGLVDVEFEIDTDDVQKLFQAGRGRLEVTWLYSPLANTVSGSVAAITIRRVPDIDRRIIVFRMERDSEPAYEPDSLDNSPPLGPFQTHMGHGPLCPDCDSHTESRSMPDGIEQWCPVCNVRAWKPLTEVEKEQARNIGRKIA